MNKISCIRNADWVIAWDERIQNHCYLRQADVVFQGANILFIGRQYKGPTDIELNGAKRCVMPGLVDIHSHPSLESAYRGIREEHGVPEMYMTGLYERSFSFWPDDRGLLASAEVAYCELLKSGVTSLCDLSNPYPGWIDLLARSGLRGFVAPGFASAQWRLEDRHRLLYSWDEQRGRREFESCLKLIEEAERHASGRLSGVVYPRQIDTCTQDLLRESAALARDRRLPLVTHASQSVNEFLVMVERHGKTPVQWAHEIGFLGPNCTLGHAIFLDEHSWLHWATCDDIRLLAETGTTVAHCPSPFARYGQVLEHFGKYRRAGINLGIGTDVAPHNILEEMRLAAVLARIAAQDINSVNTAEILYAATVGGAKALLRNDIGRLAEGCKADLVIIDLEDPWMQPARDPLRGIIYTAAERAVRDVYIDGVQVVKNHRVLTLNYAKALGQLTEAQQRMEAAVPGRDYAGRTALMIAPLSLPMG